RRVAPQKPPAFPFSVRSPRNTSVPLSFIDAPVTVRNVLPTGVRSPVCTMALNPLAVAMKMPSRPAATVPRNPTRPSVATPIRWTALKMPPFGDASPVRTAMAPRTAGPDVESHVAVGEDGGEGDLAGTPGRNVVVELREAATTRRALARHRDDRGRRAATLEDPTASVDQEDPHGDAP